MMLLLHKKNLRKIFFFVFALANLNSWGQVNKYWNGLGASWTTATTWAVDAAPTTYNSSWAAGDHAIFNVAGTMTSAATRFGNITANENVTVTTNGTMGPATGVTSTVTVASGKTLDFATTVITTSSTGMIKNGAGVLSLTGVAGCFPLGFTLNAGTMVARGINSMGGNSATPIGSLTINGGIIAATGSLNFTNRYASAITIGGDFTLGATTGLALSTANLTWGDAVALGGATRTITIGGTGTYTFSGVISNGGLTVANTAAGYLTLSGANTYTGGTTLTAGNLNINNANALGTVAGTFTISGGTIDNTSIADITTLDYPQAWNGDYTYTGSARNLNLGTGAVTLSANRQITISANTLTVGGVISGAFSLTKAGTGAMTLTGANTYTGGTTITAGTLTFNAASTLPSSGTVTLNGGTLKTGTTSGFTNSSGTGTLALTDNSTIALGTGSHTLTFAASNGVSWTAGKTITVTGWTGAYDGTTGTAGKLFAGSSATGLTAAQLAQILFFDGSTNVAAIILSTGEIVPDNKLYWGGTAAEFWTATSGTRWGTVEPTYNTTWITGRQAIFNVANSSITGATTNFAGITANENVTVTDGGTLGTNGTVATITVASGKTFDFGIQTISAVVGTGFIKAGLGAIKYGVSGGSLYTGGYTINAGTVILAGAANSMGAAALTINGGTLAASATHTITNGKLSTINIGGNFSFGDATNVSNISFGTSSAETATISLGASTARTITLNGTGTYTFWPIISGASSSLTLAATAAGTLTVSGANTYDGGTTVTGGTLQLGAAGVLADGGVMTLNGGTLKTGATSGFSETVSTLALSANSTITLGTGVHTLTFAASNAVAWTGSTMLTITGWLGGYDGTSGTAGKIFVGATSGGLTAGQLAQIQFFDVGGISHPATILASGEVVPITIPTIAVSPTTLTGFTYVVGSGPSTEQTFTCSGTNLTANIALTAPADYEISLSSGAGFGGSLTLTQVAGTVASTTIYTRLKAGLTAGTYNSENITATSTGATTKNVTCSGTVFADQAFEIQSILVDACGILEGANEMVRFQVGGTALNTSNITVSWPNNPWKGICQDAGTAATVAAINSTITGGGMFIEPTGGVIPANAQVMFFTSTSFDYSLFDFTALNYTMYAIFQCSGNTAGHFANGTGAPNPTNRTLTMNFTGFGTDAVTYNAYYVYNGDGGAVDFTPPGVPTYGSTGGCKAPIFPLPIELINFVAKPIDKKVQLSWQTASETNNDYFTIERSADAVNFEQINVTDGAGTSTQTLFYSTVDASPLSGISYYRLKQTDFDGKYKYSSIVSVDIQNNNGFQIVNTFNSIENGLLNVTVNCDNNCLVNFELYDMTGKKVFSSNENISGSNRNISIPTNNLSNGIYLLKVYNGEKVISKKVKL